MKPLLALAIGIASLTAAKAATITVAPGFVPANSLHVSFWGAPTSFTVAVGSWDGINFVQFGHSITDTGTVNGAFTANGPGEVNGEVIHVWVGIGPVSADAEIFALFRTAGNTLFPSDVSNALASATVQFHNNTPGNVVLVTGNNIDPLFGGSPPNTVNFIPEPSAILLSSFVALGLLRRRR